MLHGLREVRRRSLGVLLRPASIPPAALDERRVDDAEDAVRFAIRRFDFQRLLAGRHGFFEPALPHVEPGEFRGNVAALRIELRGALERRDRASDVVRRFKMTAEHELRVRVAALRQ